MSTGSISLDILLNKILTDAISGGNESIGAILNRYPSLSEREAHEIPWFRHLPNVVAKALS